MNTKRSVDVVYDSKEFERKENLNNEDTLSIELNEEGTEIVRIYSDSPNKKAAKMKEYFIRDKIEVGCEKYNMTVREYLTSEHFISDDK